MDYRQNLLQAAEDFVRACPTNTISAEIALTPEMTGLRIYDAPLMGVAAAGDPLFATYKQPQAVGPHHMSPAEWLPGAVSVVSFFLPYTEAVRAANKRDFQWPATEWLHARIEGQQLVMELSAHLQGVVRQWGAQALVPAADPRFTSGNTPARPFGGEFQYSSNWSERHCAYACGLGTFALTRGMITEKGAAGRFGSLVTTLEIPPTPRPYSDIYEYCTKCGACAAHCPVGAITREGGKDQEKCGHFIKTTLDKHRPYYGCAKCQVAVPCETCIPKAAKRN